MIRWLLVVALVVLVSPAAFAESKERRAEALAKSAAELGRAGKYSEALIRFEQAYELAPSAVLLYNIGRTADKAGDRLRARGALKQFLSQVADPEGRERGQKALDDVLAKWPATVRLSSPTAGALVDIDGAPRGRTPLAEPLELPPGRHVVKAAMQGKRPFEKTVELKPSEVLDLVVVLEDEPAVVTFRVDPANARLMFNGRSVLQPSEALLTMAPGSYTLQAEADGYANRVEEVSLAPGEQREVVVTLTKKPAVAPAPVAVSPVVKPPGKTSPPHADIPATKPPVPPAKKAETESSSTLTWVLVGAGAAVLLAGGVTAAVLLTGRKDGLPDQNATWSFTLPLEVRR